MFRTTKVRENVRERVISSNSFGGIYLWGGREEGRKDIGIFPINANYYLVSHIVFGDIFCLTMIIMTFGSCLS